MIYRVEVFLQDRFRDAHADWILGQIRELGIDSVTAARFYRLFFLFGDLSQDESLRISCELLADQIAEGFYMLAVPEAGLERERGRWKGRSGAETVIEVHLKSGVMDPVAASTEQAIRDMGLNIRQVRTARRYEFFGRLAQRQQETIARRLLANDCIEDVYFDTYTPPEAHGLEYKLAIQEVPVRQLDDAGLVELSRQRDFFLDLTEMRAVQSHYRKLGREPRDVEIETIAQTWSEHCVHKTFRSDVRLTGAGGELIEEIPNLIKSTIFAATRKLNKPWCISVFQDNAGVIEFDKEHAVCFKVETHNHPSALDPYGGAGTGIGGVIRDPMGTGMGALPVANTDVFCFGPADMPLEDVPKGVLHPRRIMRGVVSGVRDYGNRMGIPTVNGAVYFDEKYVGNPLVFCGTAGLLPRDKCFKNTRPGDAIVLVGGRTGRDGIHGATFSSGELTHEHETEFSGAVQIGNAIAEKKVLDTIIQARDQGLYSAITDCGAGGLSSAVGEMGEKLGAEVHLERVPLKYAGLSYSEIWISEAQERMVLAVPPENVQRILKVFTDEGVEATVIGNFGASGTGLKPVPPILRLFYQGQLVGELDMAFLHDGLPRPTKAAVWEKRDRPSPPVRPKRAYGQTLLRILASPNVSSKEWIVRQYDHEVQGGSVIKPLVGARGDGPGDAAVVRPVLGGKKGIVLSCGMNPRLGELDPYQSALHAMDEALRNCVAVGGDLNRTAILDNFCWGNCNKPDRMGALVQSARACYDGALAYGTPFISGKDSLNNEFVTDDGRTIAIPPTLLISAISVVADVGKCVTADLKEAGNSLYLVGLTTEHLGGSHFHLVEGVQTGTDVPPVNPRQSRRIMLAVQKAVAAGYVRACHDLSEGGLAAAAAEMAFAGELGLNLDVRLSPVTGEVSDVCRLFAENAGRFLVEVAPGKGRAFERFFMDLSCSAVGKVTRTGRIIIRASTRKLVDLPIKQAKAAWQKTFGQY